MTHEIISLGIGFLEDAWEFEPGLNYPVYISEPLVVLSLGLLFNDQSFTNQQEGMIKSLRLAPNTLSLGFLFEEVACHAHGQFWRKVQTFFGSL
jgi:hypothetical protein